MKNINNDVFFSKISQRVKNGDFDQYFTIPFMTRDMFLTSIQSRITKKLDTGGTPILSDAELQDCLEEAKETAMHIIALYLKLGFMVRTETGFEMTKKMQTAIKAAYKS